MMPRGLPKDGEGGYRGDGELGPHLLGWRHLLSPRRCRHPSADGQSLRLQHALRAINAARDFRREWDFAETLAIGDKATGTAVLMRQFETMGKTRR